MIIVIQCAASKRLGAGHMIAEDGRLIDFVANPKIAPADCRRVYARPDDAAEGGRSWRQLIIEYNNTPSTNRLDLLPAYQLYQKDIYRRLADTFGLSNLYILSAGWGLIRADFLTPHYDITFRSGVEPYKRRKKSDLYADFNMLPSESEDDIIFLGGKDYLPLFCRLSEGARLAPIIFYNSAVAPELKRARLRRYRTATRTNWHYECANDLIRGSIQ
jgi:hypothetical protein